LSESGPPLWGASELSKEERDTSFPCLARASLPHQAEQKPKARGGREVQEPWLLGKWVQGARGRLTLLQSRSQLRMGLLPQPRLFCCGHPWLLLKGKSAPLEHPLAGLPRLPRRGFPRKAWQKLLLLWVTLPGSRRARDFSSHWQQRSVAGGACARGVTDLSRCLLLRCPHRQRGPAVNSSCNSHQQETVVLRGLLAIPAAALSPPCCLGAWAAA